MDRRIFIGLTWAIMISILLWTNMTEDLYATKLDDAANRSLTQQHLPMNLNTIVGTGINPQAVINKTKSERSYLVFRRARRKKDKAWLLLTNSTDMKWKVKMKTDCMDFNTSIVKHHAEWEYRNCYLPVKIKSLEVWVVSEAAYNKAREQIGEKFIPKQKKYKKSGINRKAKKDKWPKVWIGQSGVKLSLGDEILYHAP